MQLATPGNCEGDDVFLGPGAIEGSNVVGGEMRMSEADLIEDEPSCCICSRSRQSVELERGNGIGVPKVHQSIGRGDAVYQTPTPWVGASV